MSLAETLAAVDEEEPHPNEVPYLEHRERPPGMLKDQIAVFIRNRGNKAALDGARRVAGILQEFPYPPGKHASAV